jgi:Flp pilus assembly protein TadB
MTTNIDEKLLKFRKTQPCQEEKEGAKSTLLASTQTRLKWFLEKFNFKKMTQSKSNVQTSISIKENENDVDYEEDNDEVEETESLKFYIFKLMLKFLLWSTLFALFVRFEFGLVYFVLSLLVLIYLNTSKRSKRKRRRQGELSAYSVFNRNVERIQGTITAEQLQSNLMGGGLF